MPRIFNESSVKTECTPNDIRQCVKVLYAWKCAVCETSDNVTVAHFLKNSRACREVGVPWDVSNFVYLCGTLGLEGTCHDYFDKFQMSFVFYSEKKKWSVVGGGEHHGKIIDLPSNPRKRVVHSHFTRCVLFESLVGVDAADVEKEGLEESGADSASSV